MREIYRGFEIDCEQDYLGYRVYFNDRLFYTGTTLTQAYAWIDSQLAMQSQVLRLCAG
jgi:hypothetical protein